MVPRDQENHLGWWEVWSGTEGLLLPTTGGEYGSGNVLCPKGLEFGCGIMINILMFRSELNMNDKKLNDKKLSDKNSAYQNYWILLFQTSRKHWMIVTLACLEQSVKKRLLCGCRKPSYGDYARRSSQRNLGGGIVVGEGSHVTSSVISKTWLPNMEHLRNPTVGPCWSNYFRPERGELDSKVGM